MAGSRILQWESTASYDWAVMQHYGFQDRATPVLWVRHFVLLKGIGTLLVDQLESKGEHEYTWLFHLLPCSPIVNDEFKSVYTGFADKNLLLRPAAPQLLTGPNLTGGTINQQGRNVEAPVVEYSRRAANVVQAYLLLPVVGKECPVTRFGQTASSNSITLNLSAGFGIKRVTIIRTPKNGKDQYALSLETTSVGTTSHKSGTPREALDAVPSATGPKME